MDIAIGVFDGAPVNAVQELEEVLEEDDEGAVSKHRTPETLAGPRVILQPPENEDSDRIGEGEDVGIHDRIEDEGHETYLRHSQERGKGEFRKKKKLGGIGYSFGLIGDFGFKSAENTFYPMPS